MREMTQSDIMGLAAEANLWVTSDERLDAVKKFATLVAAAERNRTWTQDHWTEYERSIAAAEREACASIEVHLTTPDRDYTNISPLDAYEAALMDAAIAFREAIRARGQHGD